MIKNLRHVFYKEYFQDIKFQYLVDRVNFDKDNRKSIAAKNSLLLNSNNGTQRNREEHILWNSANRSLLTIPRNELVNSTLVMKVQYPGLLTGVGISHEAKIEGEFKLGMHFDYTYGMPIIYGSSVKGMLRSAFKDDPSYIRTLLPADCAEQIDIENLLHDIFYGEIYTSKGNERNEKIKKYKSKAVYTRDIFFDAVIVEPNIKGKILASDSLAPHKNKPLKDPIPISFLKIASGVSLEFRFKLSDSIIGGIRITADEKKAVFKKILRDLGIGAKTNVGYGQFE